MNAARLFWEDAAYMFCKQAQHIGLLKQARQTQGKSILHGELKY